MAERTLQTIKKLLEKSDMRNEDPYLAILAHRSCPDPSGDPSPAEKLMNRQLRTRLPAVVYQSRLPKLDEGSTVRVYQHSSPSVKAKVIEQHHTPRSYIIKTEEGQTLRRNRRDLLPISERYNEQYPDIEESQGATVVTNTREEIPIRGENGANDEDTAPASYTTRVGRVVKPPSYFY